MSYALPCIPNPQSPVPSPQSLCKMLAGEHTHRKGLYALTTYNVTGRQS